MNAAFFIVAVLTLASMVAIPWAMWRDRMDERDEGRESWRVEPARIWFWKPSWYWFGWRTIIPFLYGHDEYARRTLLFGWTVTGRVIFAVWGCGDAECEEDAAPRRLIAARARRVRDSR